MKLQLTMDNNTLLALREVTDKVFKTGAQVTFVMDFLFKFQPRLDNSEEITALPSRMEIKIT
jgi:hypothetical protein